MSDSAQRPALNAATLPALALTLNALVWGTSWWPFRHLQQHGLHPLWATVCVYALAVLVIGTVRPRAFGQVMRTPSLWVLLLASGATNAAFNWALVIGDVVRVILLFYLMPLWAALLARLLLNEALSGLALLRVLLALAGAVIVLRPEAASAWSAVSLPRSLPDWLGVIGGFAFALNNVMLKRESHRPEEGRAMAMFAGGVIVAGVLAWVLGLQGQVPWPPASTAWLPMALGLSVLFLCSNAALQYGASRLTANTTAVIMLSEVLFASGSAVWWGSGSLNAQLLGGGALILLAALLAVAERPAQRAIR